MPPKGLKVFIFQYRWRHGRRHRAYMDVFTAGIEIKIPL